MENLIIIDMQHYFTASRNKSTIKHCIKEIRKAKKVRSEIILVEYSGCGKTIKSIREEIGNYNNCKTIIKYDEDGSRKILKSIKKSNKTFRVCGVNTDQCVYATVRGLSRKLRIKVIAAGCHAEGAGRDKSRFEHMFDTMKNVEYIY